MGKKKKEHRKRVANRNKRLSESKTKIQKLFDNLIKQQTENLEVKAGDSNLNFEVINENELKND